MDDDTQIEYNLTRFMGSNHLQSQVSPSALVTQPSLKRTASKKPSKISNKLGFNKMANFLDGQFLPFAERVFGVSFTDLYEPQGRRPHVFFWHRCIFRIGTGWAACEATFRENERMKGSNSYNQPPFSTNIWENMFGSFFKAPFTFLGW